MLFLFAAGDMFLSYLVDDKGDCSTASATIKRPFQVHVLLYLILHSQPSGLFQSISIPAYVCVHKQKQCMLESTASWLTFIPVMVAACVSSQYCSTCFDALYIYI